MTGSGSAQDKPLRDLSDAELEEELIRRRRARASRRSKGTYTQPDDRNPRSPQNKQIAQYYANLELEPGASLDEVRKAYRDLMTVYHPDKHIGDPERHKAATELAQSLTRAFDALRAHLEKDRS
jgi:DnaJ-domain-containing protein 1